MRKPEYIKALTVAERSSAMKLGAVLKFAEFGVRPSEIDTFVKTAFLPKLQASLGGVGKLLMAVSLLGGIPVGAASHIIGRKLTSEDVKERELHERIRFYRTAAKQLETGLSGFSTV